MVWIVNMINFQWYFSLFLCCRGTSGIDIDLRRVDINQCPGPVGTGVLNIFGGTDKCKTETTHVSDKQLDPLSWSVVGSEI